MNVRTKGLIQAVANNDLKTAKQYAKLIIDNDKTQANQMFCNHIRNVIERTNLMELPYEIKGLLLIEDATVTFNENRYFLSERERAVADEVLGMYEVSQKLSEISIQYLNSLLLHGESGTGKTLFGKYIAYKLGLPFVYMNFSNVISSYLGSTAKNISKAFEFIENRKCVFMIDELDVIGMVRGREDVGEMARITIGLMQALDFVKNDTVIVGATNRLDMIDPALLRRFAITHQVIQFTKQEMFSMIRRFLDNVGISYHQNDVMKYCDEPKTQAVAMNDVVRAIAKAIRRKTDFQMSG